MMASHSGSSENSGGAQRSRTTSTPARSSEAPQDEAELRKARKREQDRLCQRRKREKDRENLRRLEARLNGLQNPDEPKVILDLILRHEQDQAKLTRQADRLRQIESLLQTSLQDIDEDTTATPVEKAAEVQLEAGDSKQAMLSSVTSEAHLPVPSMNQPVQLPISTTSSCEMPVNSYSTSSPILHPSIGPAMPHAYAYSQSSTSSCPPSPGPVNVLTEALLQVQNYPNTTETTFSDDIIDQHIVVLIMLHGWDAVTANLQLDPLWSFLRQTDGATSSLWPKVDRMVGMLCLRRIMKANALGTIAQSSLEPKFLRPRPSQLHVPHFPNGDYFPWPGVRERFVFESHKYLHDTFLSIFNANTHFVWNADFGATFTQSDKQLFQFSPELMQRFNDLRCWTVDASFIAAYPEFAGDIPTYNSVPPNVERGWEGYYYENEEKGTQSHAHAHAQALATAQGQAMVHGQWGHEDKRWVAASGVR